MKRFEKLSMLLLMVALIASVVIVPGEGIAAEKQELPPAPTEGTAATETDSSVSASDTGDVSIESTMYLKYWETAIHLLSGNEIKVAGSTSSYSSVDTIAVKLYLQYWDDVALEWKDVTYAGEFKNSNSSYVDGYKYYKVSGGYYYRTRGVHYVIEGGMMESRNSASNYIYIE